MTWISMESDFALVSKQVNQSWRRNEQTEVGQAPTAPLIGRLEHCIRTQNSLKQVLRYLCVYLSTRLPAKVGGTLPSQNLGMRGT